MSVQTILIVESRPNAASAIARFLRDRAYLVHSVVGDPERLDRLLTGVEFDAILLDMREHRDASVLQVVRHLGPSCILLETDGEGRSQGRVEVPFKGEVLSSPVRNETIAVALDRAVCRKRLSDDVGAHSGARVH